jgi:protein-L-isoaspartate O-methyltransferase
MADRMEEAAKESLEKDRLANTARRARMANAAEAEARTTERMAKTLRNISDSIESGKATNLDGIRNRKQVEELESILKRAMYDAIRKESDKGGYFEENKDRAPKESDIDGVNYPRYTGVRSDFAQSARRVMEIPGAKMAGERLLKLTDDTKDYAKALSQDVLLLNKVMLGKTNQDTGEKSAATFNTRAEAERAVRASPMRNQAMVVPLTGKIFKGKYAAVLSSSEAKGRGLWEPQDDPKIVVPSPLMEEIIEKVRAHNEKASYADKINLGWYFDSVMESRKRLKGAGIENAPELRAALREYLGLRDQGREANRVKELERALAGRADVGVDFFPTPANLAQRMVEALEVEPGMSVLEPSAGKGNLADAVREAVPGAQIDTIEQSGTLREILEAKNYPLIANNFDTFTTDEPYDRIIMNPPFSSGIDADHVMRAYTLLKPGGKLVAITGEGIFSRNDAKATAFREWFDSVGGTSEQLEGAFTDRREVKTTGVNSRMLIIDKAQDAKFSPMDQPAKPFYSALERAIESVGMKAAPAAGWMSYLKGQINKGGVKADEIKWSGIEEWLQLQEGKVTKEQVQYYLKANGVRVEEVMLGGAVPERAVQRIKQWLADEYGEPDAQATVGPRQIDGALRGDYESIAALEEVGVPADLLQPIYDNINDGPSKFSQYQLPGGQNYRELLLTLPQTTKGFDDTIRTIDIDQGVKLLADGQQVVLVYTNGPAAGVVVPLTDPVSLTSSKSGYLQDLRDGLGVLKTGWTGIDGSLIPPLPKKGVAQFQSSHFDQPNILAHVRFNERTDAEGKRVLFIEEIQSDWAQKGKKEGFRAPYAKTLPPITAERITIAEYAAHPRQPGNRGVRHWRPREGDRPRHNPRKGSSRPQARLPAPDR